MSVCVCICMSQYMYIEVHVKYINCTAVYNKCKIIFLLFML